MGEYLKRFLGEPVAVLASRYQYRGYVKEVGDGFVVLGDAFAVEISGRSSSSKPEVEDEIGSDVAVSFDAIELVYQPKWCGV